MWLQESPKQSHEVIGEVIGVITAPALQKRKLRHGGVQELAHSLTGSRW